MTLLKQWTAVSQMTFAYHASHCLKFTTKQSTNVQVGYSREDKFAFDTRTYSAIFPIKRPHDWNNCTVEELEEDADCNWSVCK
jgi:hypothetical protein